MLWLQATSQRAYLDKCILVHHTSQAERWFDTKPVATSCRSQRAHHIIPYIAEKKKRQNRYTH